jgi:MarR family transcriptional regulator, lower aerobic nicotinate degradation pathway regulator
MASGPAGPSAPEAARGQLNTIDGLTQLAFVIHGMLESRAAEHDLSVTQARLLGVLRDRTPTMNQLARLLGLDKSSVSGLVDRAERRGLVVRVPSAEDKRAVLVGLTDQGRSLVSQAAARFGADLTAMLDPLPPAERGALSGIVSRLLVAHATRHGVDLFAGLDTQPPAAQSRRGGR